ncbi:MAG: hypothetical protein H7145_13855 [Akkermansiaceae bacterium]|nr:hypothetical protein [Armatimonadota bacterium]
MKMLRCTATFAVTWALFAQGTTSLAGQGVSVPVPKLSGLYRAFPAVPQFGAAVGDTYVFSAKGDVYKGWIGTQSPASFDFTRARSKEPEHTGKYVISGDKITFRWSSNQSETASFSNRRDQQTGKTTLSIGSSYCFKLVPWSRPLNGTFDRSTYQGGYFDRAHLVDRFTFLPEGRVTILEDKSGPTVEGRYEISGALLTFSLPGSKQQTHSLHVFEDHKQPPTGIIIDGQPFFAK